MKTIEMAVHLSTEINYRNGCPFINKLPLFFNKFESEGFIPSAVCEEYFGNISPFDLVSEQELNDKS